MALQVPVAGRTTDDGTRDDGVESRSMPRALAVGAFRLGRWQEAVVGPEYGWAATRRTESKENCTGQAEIYVQLGRWASHRAEALAPAQLELCSGSKIASHAYPGANT